MAYSGAIKLRALALFASGESVEAVAQLVSIEQHRSISASTVLRWKQRQVPRDWDAERRIVQEKAARAIADRLAEERALLAERHFDDLECLRRAWRRALFEPHPTKPGKVCPRRLTAAELRALALAYEPIR